MRIIYFTPKILDESLSASTRFGILDALTKSADVSVLARFREPQSANTASGLHVLPILAPRVPGYSMLYFICTSPFRLARLLKLNPTSTLIIEPASAIPALLATTFSQSEARIHLDLRTLPIASGAVRTIVDRVFTLASLACARRICDSYSAITPGAADWLARHVDVPADRIAVWSTGIDGSLFDRSKYPDAPADHQLRILYHGAINKSRGLLELIEAVGIANNRSTSHIVHLTILGEGPDISQVREAINTAGLGSAVRLQARAPLTQIPQIISEHHAGILPLPDLECWNTSSPTKLLEYLAMGRPVILTDIEAHRAVAANLNSVVWAGNGTPMELADALVTCARTLDTLSSAAVQSSSGIAVRYSWEHQARILLDSIQ